ncbi:hypothetical protein Tco_1178716 [Tanacetum coccineum]
MVSLTDSSFSEYNGITAPSSAPSYDASNGTSIPHHHQLGNNVGNGKNINENTVDESIVTAWEHATEKKLNLFLSGKNHHLPYLLQYEKSDHLNLKKHIHMPTT